MADPVCPCCRRPLADAVDGICPRCLAETAFGEDEPSPPPSGSLGQVRYFGDYELLAEIARGGMGVVYRARQRSLGRDVAVKLLRDGLLASRAEAARFRAEASAVAALAHPGIVAIHEIGIHEGQPFFSMDFVAGENLAELTRSGPLPARHAAELLVAVAEAVQHAHDRGVLHRDLKPSNVLIDAAGRPRVTDFGLAKRFDDSGSSAHEPDLTLTGQVLGTPGYLSPEQAAAKAGEVSVRSDVYGLGALLFHLLTGRAPFIGESPAVILRQVAEAEPPAPRLLNPAVPRDVETIALKALAKEPSRRYATAHELADDLGRWLRGEPIRARPASAGERMWRWCCRKPALATLAGLSLASVLAVIAVVSAANVRLGAQRREAEQVKDFLKEILAAPDPSVDGRKVLVIDVLDRARRRVTNELGAQPLVRAEVQATLGNTYYQLSLYDEAEPLLRAALATYERELSSDAVKTAEAHGLLGALLNWSGRSAEGIAELKMAVAGLRLHQPEARAKLAFVLEDLGSALVSVARTREAEAPLRECLQICERNSPELDDTWVAALGDLASVVWDRGDPSWRAVQEKAIALNRRRPDRKINLATGLSNYGDGLLELGDQSGAEKAIREALAIRVELFGTNSTPVAFAHARLGTLFLARSDFAAALAEVTGALAIQQAQLAPEHRDICFTMRLQGMALFGLGRVAEAENVHRRSLGLATRLYEPDHWVTHLTACMLAEALIAQGKAAEAKPLLEAGLPKVRQAMATTPPGTLQRRRLRHYEQLLAGLVGK